MVKSVSTDKQGYIRNSHVRHTAIRTNTGNASTPKPHLEKTVMFAFQVRLHQIDSSKQQDKNMHPSSGQRHRVHVGCNPKFRRSLLAYSLR